MSSISAGTTSGTALVSTGDTTGALVLRTNGSTTAMTISTAQVVSLTSSLALLGATSGSVALTAPAVAGTQGYTLPAAQPTANGQALTATTAGVMSWATAGGASEATPTALGTVYGNNPTGGALCAYGYQAATNRTAGSNITALGYQAHYTATTGANNTAVGYQALYALTTAYGNTALGESVLVACTTGKFNCGIGYQALVNLTTGTGNIGIQPAGTTESSNPVFNVTTENNRIAMGSANVTNAYVQVAWTVVSDARDKTNFAPIGHGLSFVNQLNPISFQFKESRDTDIPHGPVRYGFKAQEILALEGDNPVIIDNEDSEKLRYNGEALVPVLVKAMQELSAALDTANARISALEAK
jgi:hypothetical protein